MHYVVFLHYTFCIFKQGDRGATPLFYALKQGNLPMVQLLLEYGARIDITMKGEGEVSKTHFFKINLIKFFYLYAKSDFSYVLLIRI